MTSQRVVTAAQMREIETITAKAGTTWQELMERAGEQVARFAIDWLGRSTSQKALVLAGPGNNGGDALVVARHLHDHGWPVVCYTWSRSPENDARLQDPLRERGEPVMPLSPAAYIKTLRTALAKATVVIDGLLGTGIQRDVTGDLATILGIVAGAGLPVVAVDIPTGVDSDTGAVRGAALPASLTVTLGHYKYGHFMQPGAHLAGQLTLGEIGLKDAADQVGAGVLLDDKWVAQRLPQRPDDAHKGTFGKAMIVAGSVNYVGAAALAAQGAMRVGAGLVTVACAGDLLSIIASKLTESTFLPLPSDLGVIATRAEEKLRPALDGYSALLIGCGIGRERETQGFLKGMLAPTEPVRHGVARSIGFTAGLPPESKEGEDKGGELPQLILDGDALSIVAQWDNWYDSVPKGTVLTPHPGEMARLLGSTVEEVQKDRVSAAKDAAVKWGQIVVLKGAGTLVAGPGGELFVSPFSNPALATAGTGDVLAGTIAGLIAQGVKPLEAACVGVYLHAMAGEALREQYGPSGGLAGDLPVLVAMAQNRLRKGSGENA